MISRLLNNWKPKLASLLVAVAVWYLFKENIRRHDQSPIVSDPGVLSASVSSTTYGIPGMATAPAAIGTSPPLASIVAERRQRHLLRLRWVELEAFSTSVADYPAQRCG